MRSWLFIPIVLPFFIQNCLAEGGPSTQPAELRQSVGALQASGTALIDVVNQLAQASGQKILVNWQALQQVHVTRDLPVTIDLSNLRLDEAMTKLLDNVGGTHTRLDYSIDAGVVTITTSEELAKNVVTQVYDVHAAIRNNVISADDLPKIIRSLCGIDPLSWHNAGGIGRVDEMDGYLIVTQTPQMQSRVSAELDQLLAAPKGAGQNG
jgi:hypothetical protein